jgi:hypothetical protein
MKLYDINGRPRSRIVSKYLIDWDKKSKSQLQFKVKQFLRGYWKNHIVYEEFPVYGTRMKVDFVNATKKMAVEVHGPQHESFNKFFHNNSRADYLASIKRDTQKAAWLEKNNFIFIEIYDKDVDNLSHTFIEEIYGISLV